MLSHTTVINLVMHYIVVSIVVENLMWLGFLEIIITIRKQ